MILEIAFNPFDMGRNLLIESFDLLDKFNRPCRDLFVVHAKAFLSGCVGRLVYFTLELQSQHR